MNMPVKKVLMSVLTALFILGTTKIIYAYHSQKIYFFYGIGCSHCSKVMDYFEKEDLFNKYPIEKKEIYFDGDNAFLFNEILTDLGIEETSRGVPTVVIGKKVLIGDKPIINSFVVEADKFLKEVNKSQNHKLTSKVSKKSSKPLDLTLAAILLGAMVDAINPCEFAVLIILMTTILATGNPRKALRAGLAFAASIFISYFLMGLGLYKALNLGGFSSWFFKLIGWIAFILGLLNIKDYFWYGKGFLMEVPLSWRPRMKKLIYSVTSPIGAFFIGFLVSLFLLPCTSGPYIVILGMLAKKVFDTQAVLYLILYNLIFISPMILISFAVYKGFDPAKAEKIRQKRLRTLHLIAGIIMLIMAVVILMGWI